MSGKRILTVTYGTFSCTLEGFDDAFDTMKAIADYFRELSAQDRYFGAVPPQPDPQMLREIAERESRRRIEARVEGAGMVLRPGAEAERFAAERGPAAPTASAAAARPERGETVAARLARIRAMVASQRAQRQESVGSIFFDEDGEDADEAAPAAGPAALPVARGAQPSAATAPAETGLRPAAQDGPEAGPTAAVEPSPEAPAAGQDHPAAPAPAGHAPAEPLPAEPGAAAPAPAEAAPEAPSAWQYVAAEPEAGSAPAAWHDIAAEPAPAEPATGEGAAADLPAGDAAEGTDRPSARGGDEAAIARATAAMAAARDALAAGEAAAGEGSAEAPAGGQTGEPRGRVSFFPRFRPASARDGEGPQHRPAADPARTGGPSDPGTQGMARETAGSARGTGATSGSARVEDQLREILRALGEAGFAPDTAAPEAAPAPPAPPPEDRPPATEPPPPVTEAEPPPARPPSAERDDRLVLGAVQRAVADDDIERIAASALSRLSEAETRRRQEAIAHLKAAVAATEADRVLGGEDDADQESEIERYRDDLSRVVRQASEPVQPLQRRTSTLVLGASLMVVPPEARRAAAPERHGPGEGEIPHGDESGNAGISFAEFVGQVAPEGLPELLEAAAAYLSIHEKLPRFSRPQIMRKVVSVAGEARFTREEGLRSFGALLRQGRLTKLERGQFALPPTSRFMQQQPLPPRP